MTARYGEATDRGYEIAMDALTDAIAFGRSARGKRWRASQPGLAERFIADEDRDEQAFARKTLSNTLPLYTMATKALPQCEAFYLSGEVSDLLEASWHTLPAVELRPTDLIVPYGFVWLATPIPNFAGGKPLSAFAWATDGLQAVAMAYIDVGGLLPWASPLAYPGVGVLADYDYPIAKVLVAFWLLSRQRLLGRNREEVSRPVRRRAKVQELKTVTVVTLRRRDYPETTGTRTVDWSHRWVTRGHWRNQWYPSEQRHKPIWISDFLKGPSDKPFVAKRRAFEFNR